MVNEKAINIYNYTVGAACVVLLLAATAIYGINLSASDIPMFLSMIIIQGVIDKFRIYTGRVWISFVSIMELASFLILGVVASAWVQFIFVLATDLIVYKKPARTISLNVGMITSKIFIGALAYNYVSHLMGGQHGGFYDTSVLLPSAVFMLCAFVWNYIFIYMYFVMANRSLIKKVIFDSALLEGISVLVSIPLALIFANIYNSSTDYNFWFAILFILPVIFSCFIFSLVRKIMFANTQLKALSKVALTINSFLDLEQTYNSVIDAICSLTAFNGCYIFEVDNNNSSMMIPVAYRIEDDIHSSRVFSFNINDSVLGRVYESPKPVIFNDLSREGMDHKGSEYCDLYKSCILVPMRRLNKCIGCIGIFSEEQRAYTDDILEFLMILSDQATIAIENAKLYKLTEEEAITDSLTYLYNQKYFYDYIERKIKEPSDSSFKMSLILFDIDHFKRINDTYGHVTGDYVLKEVARIIKSSVRKNDVVARYGGEEFTVILPDLDSQGAYIIADRIRERIGSHVFSVDGYNIRVTVSGGISEYPRVAANAIELVSYADRAMYVGAKFKGRNRVKVYDENLA